MIGDFDYTKIRIEPVLFVVLALCWGTSFVAIKVGLGHFPPLLFAAIRYSIAGAVLLGYAVVTTDRWRPVGRSEWAAVGVAGVFIIAAYHGCLYLGEQHVSGAIAAVVISLSPILTAGFASLYLGDTRLGVVEIAGLIVGFLGVVVVANPSTSGSLGVSLAGMVLVFLSGTSFALGSVLTRPLRISLPIQAMEAWAMLLGSGVLFVAGFVHHESFAAIDWTLPAITSLAYLTFVSGVAAFLIYFTLLDRTGPMQINLVGYLEPVVATLMSWLLLGQLVASSTLAGFAAIFVGFALLKYDTLQNIALATTRAVRS